jgi:hypothetical protein
MSVLPSVLSAIAATVAAVLAGLTLYVSGRREHRRWLRNSLVDSYVNYLTASFQSGGREVLQARLRGEQVTSLDEYRQHASRAHDRQTDVLTRLRIIAPPEMVKAAEALHMVDHLVVDSALAGSAVPDDDIWQQLRLKQSSAQSDFVDQARHSLRLGPSAPIRLEAGDPGRQLTQIRRGSVEDGMMQAPGVPGGLPARHPRRRPGDHCR